MTQEPIYEVRVGGFRTDTIVDGWPVNGYRVSVRYTSDADVFTTVAEFPVYHSSRTDAPSALVPYEEAKVAARKFAAELQREQRAAEEVA